ncbi:MAG: TetR/AcrR family transcriptional regulator [Rhodospirillales bacterium]
MMETPKKTTKDRILAAANRLFYSEGIRAVSVDAIADKAGVTKRTLYYHFKSKDELIAGYLAARDQPSLAAFADWYDAAQGTAADRTFAMFDRLAQNARHPKWKGCGFLRTVAELANMPGHPAVAVGAAHKKKFETWLTARYQEAGAVSPSELGRSVALLMEGAFSSMLIHREAAYAEAAGRTAQRLVESSLDQG